MDLASFRGVHKRWPHEYSRYGIQVQAINLLFNKKCYLSYYVTFKNDNNTFSKYKFNQYRMLQDAKGAKIRTQIISTLTLQNLKSATTSTNKSPSFEQLSNPLLILNYTDLYKERKMDNEHNINVRTHKIDK